MLESSALHEHSFCKHSGFQVALVVIMVMKKVTVTLHMISLPYGLSCCLQLIFVGFSIA